MTITQDQLADKIASLGTGVFNLSVLGIATQTAWPVGANFVMPHWVVQVAFVCGLVGTAIRTLSGPVAGVLILFMPGARPQQLPEPTTNRKLMNTNLVVGDPPKPPVP